MADGLAALGHWGELAQHWGLSLLAALAIMALGWMAGSWAERGVGSALKRFKGSDAMLVGFFSSLARWAVLVFAGLAALGRLGVETTSVVAVVGAAGLAIGLALQGTLASLAAGVMLLIFRHFRVGDAIECGAMAGTVRSVTLFHTEIVTAENILLVVPNALLWGAALRNLSVLPARRVVLTLPVPYPADAEAAMTRARALMGQDQRIAAEPAPAVVMSKFGDKAVEIEVTVWCEAGQAAAVKADLMAALWRECLKELV